MPDRRRILLSFCEMAGQCSQTWWASLPHSPSLLWVPGESFVMEGITDIRYIISSSQGRQELRLPYLRQWICGRISFVLSGKITSCRILFWDSLPWWKISWSLGSLPREGFSWCIEMYGWYHRAHFSLCLGAWFVHLICGGVSGGFWTPFLLSKHLLWVGLCVFSLRVVVANTGWDRHPLCRPSPHLA